MSSFPYTLNPSFLSPQIFVVNPADKKANDLLKMAEAFYVHSAPTRIGLLFLVNDKDDVEAKDDVSVAMWRAYHYIKAEENAFRGLSFITDVSITKMLEADWEQEIYRIFRERF